MAQTFTSTDVVSTTNVFSDNQSQRTNENTLRSTFSGSTQPSDPVVGQQWYDTANSKTMQYNGTVWVPVDTNGTTQVDVSNAKGSLTSLTSYLRVAHNDDGTLKSSPATAIDEFKDNALAITYLSPTSFTVPSDLTSIFTANRKVKVYLSTSTAISYVVSSTFSTVTTVTLGSAVLDATVIAVKYSIIQDGERQDTVHAADLSPYAPLASPAFTGAPTAPTATSGDSSTKLATTEFVTTAIGNTSGISVDNVASGRKITSTSGLGVTISSGTEVINSAVVNRIGNTIALPARRACLIYDKSDGTSGYVGASFPAAVASTVYRWIVDGSSTVASTVGSNNLVATGSITQTDGRCGYAALGAGGYYTAQNSTSIPAYSAGFAIRIKFKYISNGAAQTFYHDGVRKIGVGATGYLTIAGVATTFMVNTGEEHLVEIFGAGSVTTGSIYVDGNLTVTGGTVAINVTTVAPKVLANTSNGEVSVSSVEYIELLNAITDSPTAGHVANGLLFPCFYTNSNVRYNVQEVLPSNTIAIAYAMAGSSTISLYNTDDYKYGRREKSVGGNRKVFLGWLPFSSGQVLKWTNPFGTGKIRREFHWAQDIYGTNELPTASHFWDSGSYGVYPFSTTSGYNDPTSINIFVAAAASLNGAWQSSGYIGCYAEVIEDYKGVDGE